MDNNKSKSHKIGLFTCVFVLISSMFGSAIFSLSGITIYQAGPACMLSWLIAAVMMLIYGLLMSELAGYYPNSGGVYVFPAKALEGGKAKFFGWISCWGYVLSNFSAISFSAIYVGKYLSVVFPELSNYVIPIALSAIFFVFLLNVVRFDCSNIFNNILLFGLLIIMIVFIVFALSNPSADPSNLNNFFEQGHSGKFGFLSMVPTAGVAYSSVVAIAFMASEVKNPQKTIPRSTVIAISLTAVLYLLILFSCLLYVSVDFIDANPDLMMLPIFAACNQIAGAEWLTKLIGIAAVLSLLTTMVVLLALNARAISAVAKDGILFKALSYKSRSGQPIIAVVTVTLICATISLFPEFVSVVINLGIVFSVATIAIVLISYIVARRKFAYKKSFKIKCGSLLAVFLFCTILGFNLINFLTSNLVMVLIYTVVLLIVGICIYLIFYFKSK